MKNTNIASKKNKKLLENVKGLVNIKQNKSIEHIENMGRRKDFGQNTSLDYVIIGNSAAGVAAAESIRKIDKKSKISIFTYEKYFNYSKPLITYFLSGKLDLEKTYFKDSGFYEKNNIDLRLGTRIMSIDPAEQSLITDKNETITFCKLLIAGGGKPAIPEIKVIDRTGKSETLKNAIDKIGGIFTLTTLDDAIRLKKYIEKNRIKSASILGGGLIGLKAAEAFLELGIKLNIIEFSGQILSASFDKTASEIITSCIEETSSSVLTNSTIDEIYTDDSGGIFEYKLRNGKKHSCSLLVVAVGVSPDVSLLEGCAGKIIEDRGIVVDQFMKTTADNIYAAGDIIKSFDMLTEKSRNIAIWPLAVQQGNIAGKNMAGNRVSYKGGFFMNSVEILGIPVISMGLSNADDKEIEAIESFKIYNPQKRIYRRIVIRNNKVIGAILAGAIERAGIYAGLISNEIDISDIKDNIAKEDFGIIQLPEGYRKHLVVGDGIEV
jgi:NAD(P)H-nitrite reductase large subunit